MHRKHFEMEEHCMDDMIACNMNSSKHGLLGSLEIVHGNIFVILMCIIVERGHRMCPKNVQ